MKGRQNIIIAIFCLFQFSCGLDIPTNVEVSNGDFFFSTEDYFQKELDRLKNKRGFTKYVNFNGAEETMKLDTLNLQQEFNPFIMTDINKVIWSDQYKCDTIYKGSEITEIDCSSLNAKLKTCNLNVKLEQGDATSINIECKMNKMLMETMEYLTYQKDDFYQIKRIQKLKTGTCDSTLVKVTF